MEACQLPKMRILHMFDTCARGGAETLLLDVFNNFDPMEMEIFFCTFQGGELEQDLRGSKAHFIKIPREFPIDINTVRKLRSFIKQNKIDIVHTHILVDTVHAYLASIGLDVKLIHSYHGYDFGIDLKNRILQKIFISKTDANLFVSKALLAHYTEKYHPTNRCFVVYNGVDPNKLTSSGKNIRKELGIEPSCPLLGMVGNFNNTGRDHLTVCEAVAKLLKTYPQIHFLFVGRKNYKYSQFYDQCVHFCRTNNLLDNVHFLGSRSDVPDILHALDLYVYASNHDTFGLTLVEAMMCDIPVIANDLPPFLEISDNGKYIDIYQTKNVPELVNKMSAWIESPNNKINTKEYAEQNFSIQKHIKVLFSVYQEVLH